MTLALGIAPTVARDFSVMIQSVGEHHPQISLGKEKVINLFLLPLLSGMSAASFTILWMKVKVWLEYHTWYLGQQNVFCD